MATKIFRNV